MQPKYALNPLMEREGSRNVLRFNLIFKTCQQEQILLDTQRAAFKIAAFLSRDVWVLFKSSSVFVWILVV